MLHAIVGLFIMFSFCWHIEQCSRKKLV